MKNIKSLINTFEKENKEELYTKNFAATTLHKIIFDGSSMESSLRALFRKSALLRKRGAEHKCLIKDKNTLDQNMKDILGELNSINLFMIFLLKKMPGEVNDIADNLKKNQSYIKINSK